MNPGLGDYYRNSGQPARGKITIVSLPTAGDTIEIAGTTYTFGTDFIGASRNEVAESLTAVVNSDRSRIHLTPTVPADPVRLVYALFFGSVVAIVACEPGDAGNSLTLASSTSAMVVSGATLSGGAEGALLTVLNDILSFLMSPSAFVAPAVYTTTPALANGLQVTTSAAVLYKLTYYNANVAEQFVQLHNAASEPIDTTPAAFSPKVSPELSGQLDFGPSGVVFSNGIYVCNSTTALEKTIGLADCQFTAVYRQMPVVYPTPAGFEASTALEASHVIYAGDAILYGLLAVSTNIAEQNILIFDSATVPVDTTMATFAKVVGGESNVEFDFGAAGVRCPHGIAVCNSTTIPTKTIGAADCAFVAVYRAV